MRPGRIDRKTLLAVSDEEARLDILEIHSGKTHLSRGIDLPRTAGLRPGAWGAEVKAISTEAGTFALRDWRVYVSQEDLAIRNSPPGEYVHKIRIVFS